MYRFINSQIKIRNLHFIKKKLNRNMNTLIPWQKQTNIYQKQIIGANGCYIYDRNNKIVDFTSGAMVVNLGHNNKYIQTAFNDHIGNGIAYVPSNFSTKEREKLSERLLEESNMIDGKVLYCNAGADANEMAAFIANEYQYYTNQNNNKNRVLSFKNSFHGGSTIGASLLSGDERRTEKQKYYKLALEPLLENPSLKDNGSKSLSNISKHLESNVSAILVEGSSGSAGCILYPDNYLKILKELCDKKDVLMICDEVMSGFGRTGSFFAHFKQNVKPDIITCAKAITCGYIPLGAVIINHKVSKIFDDTPLMCGLTYSGHPLSCTVANKCMDIYLENDKKIIKNVDYKSEILKEKCIEIASKYSFIKEYRNNGLLGCFEMNLDNNQLLFLSDILLNNGVYCMRIRHNIFTAPPLIINENELYNTLLKIDNIFNRFEKKYI